MTSSGTSRACSGFKAKGRLTEGDDVVVAEGVVHTQRKDGTVLSLAFRDVFEMQGARIRRLTSYLMETR